MPLKVWNGSTWAVKPLKRWNGSAWVTALLKRWNGSAWVAVAGEPISSATLSPTILNREGLSTNLTTNPCTCTVVGGAALSYAWGVVSGGTGIAINSASSATTTFTASGLLVDEMRTGAFRCVVTDTATGQVVNSNNVVVSITRVSA